MPTWRDDKPAVSDNITDGVGYIEENLEYLHTLAENHYKSLSDTSTDIGKDACYFVDPSATDQGASYPTSSRSAYDLIAAIGSSKNARLVFQHKAASGNTTTYRWKTQDEIPANIDVVIEPGVVLDTTYAITDAGVSWTWTVESGNIYKLDQSISQPSDVLMSDTALVEVADIASITGAGKWCWANSTVYAWLTGDANPNSIATVEARVTITIQNVTSAPDMQWIAGDAMFALGPHVVVKPEWCGVIDGTADEVQINKAIEIADKSNNTVKLGAKTYTCAATIYYREDVPLIGSGKTSTVLDFSALTSGNCLDSYNNTGDELERCHVEGFTILGGSDSDVNGLCVTRTSRSRFHNIYIKNIGGIGVHIDGRISTSYEQAHYNEFQFVEVGKVGAGTVQYGFKFSTEYGGGCNRNNFLGCRVNGASQYAYYLTEYASTNRFIACAAENVGGMIYINGERNEFFGFKGESATGNGLVLNSSADGNVFIGTLGDVTGDKLVNLSGDSVCDANLIFIDSATGISALHDLHAVDSSNTQVTLVRGTVGETAIGTDATATTTLRRVLGLATDGSIVVLDVGTGSNAPSSNTFRVLPDGGIGVGNMLTGTASSIKNKCIPVYNANGSLVGYVPVYSTYAT